MSDLTDRLRRSASTLEYGSEKIAEEQIEAADRIEALEAALEMSETRYQWAANELLACDYGDNENDGQVGWHVYGWRTPDGKRRIYGASINSAIDSAMEAQALQETEQ